MTLAPHLYQAAAISDWLFPQLQGMASDSTLKLLAWTGFAVSLVVAWWVAGYVDRRFRVGAKA